MIISSPDQLVAALKSASAAGALILAPGHYDGIKLTDIRPDSPVVIRSADPQDPADIRGLKISRSANLEFQDLDMTADVDGQPVDPYYAFRIQEAENIKFTRVRVSQHSDNRSRLIAGFYITHSKNISISQSSFLKLNGGICANNNSYLSLDNNTFVEMDKGGIELGGDEFVNIKRNTFSDFIVTPGTHPDAIQIYTQGTTHSSHDVNVVENLFYRGRGDAAQGIFVQDEVGGLPFYNVTIADNAIIGGMWDSLYLRGVRGNITVSNNVVASWQGNDVEGVGTPAAREMKTETRDFTGYLWLRGDFSKAQLTEEGNLAQAYMVGEGTKSFPPRGNQLVGSVSDKGIALLHQWVSRDYKVRLARIKRLDPLIK